MDDSTWRARATLDLVAGGGRREWNEQQVAAALREAAEAGVAAYELHGDPASFATARLAERPPGELATVARDGRHDTHLSALWMLVVVAAGQTISSLVRDGWTTTPPLAAVVLAAGMMALVGGAALALAWRSAGRPAAARTWWLGVVLGVPTLAVTVTLIPRDVLAPTLPTPTPLVAAALLAAVLARVCARIVDGTDDDWFDDLARRLVGRHDLAPALARSLADDSRSHWAQVSADQPGAGDPTAEFGDIDDYAAALAVDRPASPPLLRRLDPYTWRLLAVPIVAAAVAAVVGVAPTWQLLLYVPAAAAALWLAFGEWRRSRR